MNGLQGAVAFVLMTRTKTHEMLAAARAGGHTCCNTCTRSSVLSEMCVNVFVG